MACREQIRFSTGQVFNRFCEGTGDLSNQTLQTYNLRYNNRIVSNDNRLSSERISRCCGRTLWRAINKYATTLSYYLSLRSSANIIISLHYRPPRRTTLSKYSKVTPAVRWDARLIPSPPPTRLPTQIHVPRPFHKIP